jgi:hypothetical protein
MPFIGLFENLKGSNKFEASGKDRVCSPASTLKSLSSLNAAENPETLNPCSGMTQARGWLWVVFDNLHAIGRVDEHFVFRGSQNKLMGEVKEESQFEVSSICSIYMHQVLT